jgi:prepilin-type N-terminal cleavage/methylation domain-containing protein
MKLENGKGFTLVEILFVISIIGLMASIIFTSVSSARIKARDARRIGDINNFAKAFELCYSEKGDYPNEGFWDYEGGQFNYCFSCGVCYGSFSDLIKQCISSEIKDPINQDPWAYYYFYFQPAAGSPINPACWGKFAFMAHLERPTYQNVGCFHEAGKYEYWVILSY